ncbi:MAG: adenosine deaminase [Chloroflexota bacterium]|nr:adenosine deaminase [Chloroflexota bacterium]
MTHARTKRPVEFYQALPKVELHRHLEGSVRVETLLDIGQDHGLIRNKETKTLRPLVQIGKDEPYTFENFLSKFSTLRSFYRSPDVIGRITREAIEDAAKDNIRYLELRFTPVALSKAEGFPLDKVIDWVIAGVKEGEDIYGVKTGLIASINRHESVDLAKQIVQLAIDRKQQGIVGLDLAGNEAEFSARPFAGILNEAQQDGLKVTVHAGEWSGASNVVEAIQEVGARRIGHGVRVVEDKRAMALARREGVVFEVCITSNYQSGVVSRLDQHPYPRMLDAGLKTTLNTDDPSISDITLSQEYRLACERLGIPLSVLRKQILIAAQAAFLPDIAKQALIEQLEKELDKKIPQV